MPIPTSKSQLLQAIQSDFEKLFLELQSIPPDQVEVKELEGHAQNTTMSVKDLVAYLLGWGQLVLKWSHKKENGEPVDFPETGYKWNELGLLHKNSTLIMREMILKHSSENSGKL